MYKFRKKNQLKNRLYSPLVLIALLIVVFFLAKATYFMYKRASISEEKLNLVQNELKEVESKRAVVWDEVNYLGTTLGIEEEIRTKFNLVKNGEKVIVIVDPETEEVVEEEEGGGIGKFFRSIKSWFGGN